MSTSTKYERSLLHKLEEAFNIDVDGIDPSAAKAMPFKPHNRQLLYSVSQTIGSKLAELMGVLNQRLPINTLLLKHCLSPRISKS